MHPAGGQPAALSCTSPQTAQPGLGHTPRLYCAHHPAKRRRTGAASGTPPEKEGRRQAGQEQSNTTRQCRADNSDLSSGLQPKQLPGNHPAILVAIGRGERPLGIPLQRPNANETLWKCCNTTTTPEPAGTPIGNTRKPKRRPNPTLWKRKRPNP